MQKLTRDYRPIFGSYEDDLPLKDLIKKLQALVDKYGAVTYDELRCEDETKIRDMWFSWPQTEEEAIEEEHRLREYARDREERERLERVSTATREI